MNLMYVAADGSFGDAQDLLVVDVDAWSASEIEEVFDASDMDRSAVVAAIARNHEVAESEDDGRRLYSALVSFYAERDLTTDEIDTLAYEVSVQLAEPGNGAGDEADWNGYYAGMVVGIFGPW